MKIAPKKFVNSHIVKTNYTHPNFSPYIILNDDDTVLGYVWTITNLNQSRNMYVSMIEVIDKGKGIGTQIIDFLFNEFSLETMWGNILREPNDRAFYFWESLGAEFQTKHLLEDLLLNTKKEISFILRNPERLKQVS